MCYQHKWIYSLIILTALLLCGCMSPVDQEAATPTAAPKATLRQRFPDLAAALPLADEISISVSYYNPGSWQPQWTYYLKRHQDMYSSVTVYRIWPSQSERQQFTSIAVTNTLMVSITAVQAAIQPLIDAPLEEGPYIPQILATDASPDITMNIETPAGTVRFYSRSISYPLEPNTENHIPWGSTIAGRWYTINSTEPDTTLEMVKAIMLTDTFRKQGNALLKETLQKLPTPTPR